MSAAPNQIFRWMAGALCACALGQAYGQEAILSDDPQEPTQTAQTAWINAPIEDYALRPKPWLLRKTTKDWQWVAYDPRIYYPPHLDPSQYPAIIEHEKIHLLQQRKSGRFKWAVKYIFSKKFRFAQELEPIVVELSNLPPEGRGGLIAKYAQDLSGKPYSKAAKTPELAMEAILSKAEEMGVAISDR